MNYRMILYLLGYVLLLLGGFLLLPVIVALIYGAGDWSCLLLTAGLCAVLGVLLRLCKPKQRRAMNARDGFVVGSWSLNGIGIMGAVQSDR